MDENSIVRKLLLSSAIGRSHDLCVMGELFDYHKQHTWQTLKQETYSLLWFKHSDLSDMSIPPTLMVGQYGHLENKRPHRSAVFANSRIGQSNWLAPPYTRLMSGTCIWWEEVHTISSEQTVHLCPKCWYPPTHPGSSSSSSDTCCLCSCGRIIGTEYFKSICTLTLESPFKRKCDHD